MTITKQLTSIVCLLLFSSLSLAYNTKADDDACKKPKFRTFEPEHLSEVEPGSKISFHVSRNADPTTIKAETRGYPIKLDIVNKMVFFVATGQLPANLKDQYARINLKARDNECLGQGGWLLKIKPDSASSAQTTESSDQNTAEQPSE